MATLPCVNDEHVMQQVRPTANLLTNLDELHPDVLLAHDIQPKDYKSGLVFRSAVESIRGQFIASSTVGRQGMVDLVLRRLRENGTIADYKQSGAKERYDFQICVGKDPDYFSALEVKGGEGNSINISTRPFWAREFGVWCHLDGAVVNQPAHGAHSIVHRITNEMVRRDKHVDVLFFKDLLCGTRARPCPKYFEKETTMGLDTAPDIFLFPKEPPTKHVPAPRIHTLKSLRLPPLVLDLFGVPESQRNKHIWEVHVSVVEAGKGRMRRQVRIEHQGQIVDEALSRPWMTE